MSYLCLILFLSLIPLTWCTSIEEDEVYMCSDGRIWQCVVERVDEPATLNQLPSFAQNPIKSSRRRKPPIIYFSYLNKINPEDSSIYVAARLKIELQQLVLENATGMSIQILPKNPNLKPTYYHAQIAQQRPIPDGFSIDFTFPIEKKLEYEQHYTMKFDLLPLHLSISTKKQLFVQGHELPEVDCSQKIEQDDKRQYITSRFTSAFRQITFFPYHSTVNLSFYAAPRPYCLSYEVQLSLGGSHVVETHFIHPSEMQERLNGSTLIGTVTLTKIRNDQNYSLRLIPYSETNSCVCLDCSCMLVESQIFTLPQMKALQSEPNTPSPNLLTKPAQSSPPKQVIRIEIVDDRSDTNYMFFLIVFFCILSLTFISASLVILLCRHTNKPKALLLVKSARISQQEKPLLHFKTTQTILLLNAEPTKKNLVEMLAKMLEQGGHVRVMHAERAQKSIEQNLQAWCHNVLLKADKIVLFHSNRAAYLLSHTGSPLANQNAIFDIAFQTLISFVRINDPKIVHACWNNQQVTLFRHVETVYVLPRDLHFLFNVMDVTPTFEQNAQFQDEYQKAIQPVEEVTTVTPQSINIEVQAIGQTEINSPENAPFDSGFITISTMGDDEEQLLVNDSNRDIISIVSSEDSGFIL